LLNLHTVEPTVAERNAVESKMIRYKYGSGEA
jgi:hypothetical protein